MVPKLPYAFDTNDSPSWFVLVVGGKRQKNKPKTKPTKKKQVDPPGDFADDVIEIIQHRLQMPHNSQKCMARTFRLFQCAHKAFAMLPSGLPGVCGNRPFRQAADGTKKGVMWLVINSASRSYTTVSAYRTVAIAL